MALKGYPLLITAVLATAGTLVALVVLWNRGGRARFLLRTVAILLCQALAAFTVGLEVNRAGDFYPSWAALTEDTGARAAAAAAPVTAPPRAVSVRHGGTLATWAPPGSARWHLAEAPRLRMPTQVPAGRRLPVLVLLLPPAGHAPVPATLSDPAVAPLARDAGSGVVVVVLRPTGPAAVPALATELPRVLTASLPVDAHDWGLVGVGSAATSAVDLAARDALRYGAVALVAAGTGEPTSATVARLRAATTGTGSLAVLSAPATARGVPVHVAATLDARVVDALAWAGAQLPAPLAPAQVVWSGGFFPPGR